MHHIYVWNVRRTSLNGLQWQNPVNPGNEIMKPACFESKVDALIWMSQNGKRAPYGYIVRKCQGSNHKNPEAVCGLPHFVSLPE